MRGRLLIEDMAVDVPEGEFGSVRVERFEVTRDSFENLRLAMGGRQCIPGTYTRLLRNGALWMSDTTAERSDHLEPAMQIAGSYGSDPARSVLVGGLGLGMILQVALLTPDVEQIDVVEIDADVIGAVAPHYEKKAADRGIDLRIHHSDLYDIKWPTGTRWDVAWFDIWADISTDVLEQMSPLRRSYGHRVRWQGCWGREWMLYERRREQRSAWS